MPRPPTVSIGSRRGSASRVNLPVAEIPPAIETPVLQGWLEKKGEKFVKTFSKRFFRQGGAKLFYYKDPNDKNSPGFIDLTSFTIDTKGSVPGDFSFDVHCPGRVYELKAETAADYNYWIAGLNNYKTSSRPASMAVVESLEDENARLNEKLKYAEGRLQEMREQYKEAATAEEASQLELLKIREQISKHQTLAEEAQRQTQVSQEEMKALRGQQKSRESTLFSETTVLSSRVKELEAALKMEEKSHKSEMEVLNVKLEGEKSALEIKLKEAEKRTEVWKFRRKFIQISKNTKNHL